MYLEDDTRSEITRPFTVEKRSQRSRQIPLSLWWRGCPDNTPCRELCAMSFISTCTSPICQDVCVGGPSVPPVGSTRGATVRQEDVGCHDVDPTVSVRKALLGGYPKSRVPVHVMRRLSGSFLDPRTLRVRPPPLNERIL